MQSRYKQEKTVGLGNCAFNAISLALFEEKVLTALNGKLPASLDPNEEFSEFIELAIKESRLGLVDKSNWDAVKAKLISLRGQNIEEFQNILGSILRNLSFKLVKNEIKNNSAEIITMKDQILAFYDEYVRRKMEGESNDGNEDDIFSNHTFIEKKFDKLMKKSINYIEEYKKLCANIDPSDDEKERRILLKKIIEKSTEDYKAELSHWWYPADNNNLSSGYFEFSKAMKKAGKWGGDHELGIIGRYFHTNVVIHKDSIDGNLIDASIDHGTLKWDFRAKAKKRLTEKMGGAEPTQDMINETAKEDIRELVTRGIIDVVDPSKIDVSVTEFKLRSNTPEEHAKYLGAAPSYDYNNLANTSPETLRELVRRDLVTSTIINNKKSYINASMNKQTADQRKASVNDEKELLTQIGTDYIDYPTVHLLLKNDHYSYLSPIPQQAADLQQDSTIPQPALSQAKPIPTSQPGTSTPQPQVDAEPQKVNTTPIDTKKNLELRNKLRIFTLENLELDIKIILALYIDPSKTFMPGNKSIEVAQILLEIKKTHESNIKLIKEVNNLFQKGYITQDEADHIESQMKSPDVHELNEFINFYRNNKDSKIFEMGLDNARNMAEKNISIAPHDTNWQEELFNYRISQKDSVSDAVMLNYVKEYFDISTGEFYPEYTDVFSQESELCEIIAELDEKGLIPAASTIQDKSLVSMDNPDDSIPDHLIASQTNDKANPSLNQPDVPVNKQPAPTQQTSASSSPAPIASSSSAMPQANVKPAAQSPNTVNAQGQDDQSIIDASASKQTSNADDSLSKQSNIPANDQQPTDVQPTITSPTTDTSMDDMMKLFEDMKKTLLGDNADDILASAQTPTQPTTSQSPASTPQADAAKIQPATVKPTLPKDKDYDLTPIITIPPNINIKDVRPENQRLLSDEEIDDLKFKIRAEKIYDEKTVRYKKSDLEALNININYAIISFSDEQGKEKFYAIYHGLDKTDQDQPARNYYRYHSKKNNRLLKFAQDLDTGQWVLLKHQRIAKDKYDNSPMQQDPETGSEINKYDADMKTEIDGLKVTGQYIHSPVQMRSATHG